MSDIVELLHTIGELAKVVAARDAEIEEMKMAFDNQIKVINAYIAQLEHHLTRDGDADPTEDKSKTHVEDFIKNLHIYQAQCSENKIGDDYMLVPKHKLKYLLKRPSLSPTHGQAPKISNPGRLNGLPSSTLGSGVESRNPGKSLSKRTCSYCSQPGHSRARCLERLATPPRQK